MSLLKSSALDLKIIHIVYMKQDWLLRASLEIQHSVCKLALASSLGLKDLNISPFQMY